MSDSEDNNSAEENSDISGNEEVAAVEVEPIEEGGLEEDDDDEGADVTWEDLVRFEFAWSTTTHVVLTFRTNFLIAVIFPSPQGLNDVICDAIKLLKWKKPSKIQREAIPVALQGKDVIGLAETGSGKTGAFALPILQSLMETPQTIFALILTPTRELADQIGDQFKALGELISI